MSASSSYIWPNLAGGPVLSDKQGIDYLIVSDDQTKLEVHFLKPVTTALTDFALYRVEGGDRVKAIAVLSAAKAGNTVVTLTLDRFGDWSSYRLVIVDPSRADLDIDPAFSWIRFSFKVKCPRDLDCKEHLPGFERFPALKDFDYQAKDYESFKQAMLDRLPLTIPDWWDRAEADFGLVVVDLLAYAGDRLSYYQDRVAAESLLTTARLRQSVSGHLKLTGYTLDPGETASAFVYFEVDRDRTIPEGVEVETPAPEVASQRPVSFTLTEAFAAYRKLNKMALYDFSHPSLVIPKGALQASVVGQLKGLEQGSVLVFVKDFSDTTSSGRRKMSGQYHRITLASPPLYRKSFDNTEITVLTWDESCALPWDVPLSQSVLLGNVARLYQGKKYKQTFSVDGALESFDLPEGPLGYRNKAPMLNVRVDGEDWSCVDSLKESMPYDLHCQVVDRDDGKSRILFGDNVNGFRPARDSIVEVEYQAGLGASGNVAAGTLTRSWIWSQASKSSFGASDNVAAGTLTRLSGETQGITFVTNLFAATNGRDQETLEEGKLRGPKMIKQQERAVTLADYEREAMAVSGVSRAMARFIWTGSWNTVRVTIDPKGTEELSDELKAEVYSRLVSRKMAGCDIQLFPVRYVPLEIEMQFCLNDRTFRDQAFQDLNSALGKGSGADGVYGLFHPDNWSFGQGVKLSSLYAAAARVQGIECAQVVTFKRLRKPPGNELEKGELPIQWDEIARMDNDRNFPERGKLALVLTGGR